MTIQNQFIEGTVHSNHIDNWKKEHELECSFVSSFPRSGNGWIRVVLVALILEQVGAVDIKDLDITTEANEKGVTFAVFEYKEKRFKIDAVVPDMYHYKSEEHNKMLSNISYAYDKLFKTHHVVKAQQHKVAFLFRRPLDCMVSTSLLFNTSLLAESPELINDCVRYFSKYYAELLQFYLQEKNSSPERCLFLSHERLSSNSELAIEEFRKLTQFIQMDTSDELLQKALNRFPYKSAYNSTYMTHLSEDTKLFVGEALDALYEEAMRK